MFARIRRSLQRFFARTSRVNHQPLNPVSLIVIILIDIFILVNVFTGLNDISQWKLSPTQTYPCYSEWQDYRNRTAQDKDYQAVRLAFRNDNSRFQDEYQREAQGHLGSVSTICLNYADRKDEINTRENQQLVKNIDQKTDSITRLEGTNRNIRAQYDSTLLEKIAGQNREQSINAVGAEKAKQELERNDRQISQLKQDSSTLKAQLIAKPNSVNFLNFLQNDANFRAVESGYKQAAFWYPSIQLAFQALFLVPLLVGTGIIHRVATKKRYGLIALISWHLLIIFFIPLVLKIFEFLQVGALFKLIFDFVSAILGGLLFLVSYLYILIIPLAGFVIIKACQKLATAKPKLQPALLVQQSRCVNCTRTIRQGDRHCPHCGYDQTVECNHCHELTYKHLPYCKQCGTGQDLS